MGLGTSKWSWLGVKMEPLLWFDAWYQVRSSCALLLWKRLVPGEAYNMLLRKYVFPNFRGYPEDNILSRMVLLHTFQFCTSVYGRKVPQRWDRESWPHFMVSLLTSSDVLWLDSTWILKHIVFWELPYTILQLKTKISQPAANIDHYILRTVYNHMGNRLLYALRWENGGHSKTL